MNKIKVLLTEPNEEEKMFKLEMKNECVTRLRLLKLNQCIRDFYNDILNISYVDKNVIDRLNEYEKQMISMLQDMKKIMIYHVIRMDDNITYYLYADRNKNEWVEEKRALVDGFIEVICIKTENKIIGVETTNGIITKIV